MRGHHELVRHLSGQVRSIVGLHELRRAVSGKPLLQKQPGCFECIIHVMAQQVSKSGRKLSCALYYVGQAFLKLRCERRGSEPTPGL